MARKKKGADLPEKLPEPIGPILKANLYRLGYGGPIRVGEIADKVAAMGGGSTMTKQRISAILKSKYVEHKTLRTLAEALGVEPGELIRPTEGGPKP